MSKLIVPTASIRTWLTESGFGRGVAAAVSSLAQYGTVTLPHDGVITYVIAFDPDAHGYAVDVRNALV